MQVEKTAKEYPTECEGAQYLYVKDLQAIFRVG